MCICTVDSNTCVSYAQLFHNRFVELISKVEQVKWVLIASSIVFWFLIIMAGKETKFTPEMDLHYYPFYWKQKEETHIDSI